MSEILIQCQDLHKRYGRKEALCGVNLRLESGKIVGLLGPNGSGKTTLIKILNGLLKPDQGMVTIDGEEPGIHTKSVISYLPDKPYFADWMKITDLLQSPDPHRFLSQTTWSVKDQPFSRLLLTTQFSE